MDALQFELAAEYLVMAATLAEIKSRMMLPRDKHDEEEEDPKSALIKRFQEYQRYLPNSGYSYYRYLQLNECRPLV